MEFVSMSLTSRRVLLQNVDTAIVPFYNYFLAIEVSLSRYTFCSKLSKVGEVKEKQAYQSHYFLKKKKTRRRKKSAPFI